MSETLSNAYRSTPNRRRRRVTDIAHRTVEANGIPIHLAEAGSGPVALLCHGFPESWYSWRHQMRALAEAGYRAVAPDMRGYGQTGQPQDIDQYTLFHLVGDMVGVLDALSAPQAVVVGHDWGAPVAWHCALFRPDRFRAVGGLSVPFVPRGSTRPTSVRPQTESSLFYQLRFPAPGVAEAELGSDPRDAIRRLLYSGKFGHSGFRGGLNLYRNIDRNWELLAPFAGAKVTVPALYMAGDRDVVVAFRNMDKAIANLADTVPRLRG